jgi:hypothetical protein
MTTRNDPALMRATPASALPQDSPEAARLASEVARIDAAVAKVTATLDFFEEPGHYAAAQRRLA